MPKRRQNSILASASDIVAINNAKFGRAQFKTSLEVRRHKEYKCCSQVGAEFLIKLESEENSKADFVEIGYAEAYIIDRTLTDDKDGALWLTELRNGKAGKNISEVMRLVRHLYGPKGFPARIGKDFAEELKADKIVHIDTFELYKDWRGGRLGDVALDGVNRLLSGLNNGYAFQGFVGLMPATPDDVADAYKHKTSYQQESALVKFYERNQYRVLIRGKEEEEDSTTIMGRVIEAEAESESIEEPRRKRATR